MDKKELLKRWALAYTEPSLFYIPWKEYNSDDEYFTVTLIPHVNYYDVFDEKVIKNATLYDIYSKGFTKEQQNVYGGLHDKIRGESNVYIAKDLNGNIVASSTVCDYMSVAKKQKEEKLLDYTLEYYDVDIYTYSSYNTKRYIIKNILNIDDIEELKNHVENRLHTLFILQTGEIYAYISVLQKVGQYHYKTGKFHFTDKNFYITYMVVSCGQIGSYDYYAESINQHPILKLKKGTYIIEQLVSSNSCNLMTPMKIDVSDNMVINYRTKLNGFILRAFLEKGNDSVFEWSKILNYGTDYTLVSMNVGEFGTFISKSQIYDISDYSLQVEQDVKTAGASIDILTEDKKYVITYGSNSIWTIKHIEQRGDFFDPSLILYPKSFSEETISHFNSSYPLGTKTSIDRMDYYSSFFPYFKIYSIHPSEPFDRNKLPSILEVEKIISSKTPEEWLSLRYRDINNYYGIEYHGSSSYAVNLYFTKDAKQATCLDDTIYADEHSDFNLVSHYYKSDSVDIEKYKQYVHTSNSYYLKDDDRVVFRNYTTCLSGKFEYADGWNEEKISEMTYQMRGVLFNNQ